MSALLAGRRVLVSAGPTYEDIDPVRFLGNRSSGRMGFALVAAAAALGAEAVLVAGPVHLDTPPGVRRIDVPVDRGMSSYWLLLTREELLPRLQKIHSLEQLRPLKLTFGFPLGQNLRPVWREHLDIQDAPNQAQAMRMLQQGRFDAIMVNPGHHQRIQANLPADGARLTYEPNLLLEHPSATCFAIGEQNEQLAQQLQQGLQAVIRNDGARRISEATRQKNAPAELNLGNRQRLLLPASETMERILKPYSEWMYKP